jgi:hypothetical protein
MVMTNTERQREYKEKLYAQGYKQKIFWVLRKESDLKMGKSEFLKKLERLTKKLSKEEVSRLYADFISILRGKE